MADKITQDYQVVTPAYGRDYKNAADAKKDFLAGKDFLIQSVIYGFNVPCDVSNFEPGVKVTVRYKSRTMSTIVTVP
jgi:hypothetical protein